MSKIVLPKTYLSWSQMEIWEKNPERYKREYFENAKKLDTKYLQFGKGIAKLVEDLCNIQKQTGDKTSALKQLVEAQGLDFDTETVLRELETEGTSEYEIKAVVGEVSVLSYMDKYRDWDNTFLEYKTAKKTKEGKDSWNQAKVQKHGQLLFYAVGLKAITGKMPEYCDLVAIETKERSEETDDFWAQADKKLCLTGRIKSFRRVFDERELAFMEERIVKVATEISDAYSQWIKQI